MENKALPKYWLATHKNVSNVLECQEQYCQPNKKCSAFVYILDTKECTLKMPQKRFLNIIYLRNSTGRVFGPKYCPGNKIFLVFKILFLNPALFRCFKQLFLLLSSRIYPRTNLDSKTNK